MNILVTMFCIGVFWTVVLTLCAITDERLRDLSLRCWLHIFFLFWISHPIGWFVSVGLGLYFYAAILCGLN